MPQDGELQHLRGFLRYAQASWSERDVDRARDKLATVGIETLPELVLTLRPGAKDINQLLKAHGEKGFSTDTLSALTLAASRLQSPLIEFLRGAQPEWSEAKLRAVLEKIVRAGILDIDELRLTLRPGAKDSLNRRLASRDEKRLAQDTLLALRCHAAAQARPVHKDEAAGAPGCPGPAPAAAGGAGGISVGLPLAEFLREAPPEWSPTELRTIEAKLVAVGICTAEDLVASLLPGVKRHLNKRLRSGGQTRFRSHTILELQAYAAKFRGECAPEACQEDVDDEVQSVEHLSDDDAEDEHALNTCWKYATNEATNDNEDATYEGAYKVDECDCEAGETTRPWEDQSIGSNRCAADALAEEPPPPDLLPAEPDPEQPVGLCGSRAAAEEATRSPEEHPSDGASPLPLSGQTSTGGCAQATPLGSPGPGVAPEARAPAGAAAATEAAELPGVLSPPDAPAEAAEGAIAAPGGEEARPGCEREDPPGQPDPTVAQLPEEVPADPPASGVADSLGLQRPVDGPTDAPAAPSTSGLEEPAPSSERNLAQPPLSGGEGPPAEEPAAHQALGPTGSLDDQRSVEGVAEVAGLDGGLDVQSRADGQAEEESALPVQGGVEPRGGGEREAVGPLGPGGAEALAGASAGPLVAGLDEGSDVRSPADRAAEAEPFPPALVGEEPPAGPPATPLASQASGDPSDVCAKDAVFQCATPGCHYQVSPLAEKGAYCCLGCLMGRHGDSCARRVAAVGAQKAPRGWRSRPGMEVFELERERYGIPLWSMGADEEEIAGRPGQESEVRVDRPVLGPSGWLLGEDELRVLRLGFAQELQGAREAAKAWDRRELFLFLQSHGRFDPSAMAAKHRRPPPLGGAGRVSVVVPTMERRHPWHQQLYETFDAQDWPDKELIVVETYFDKPSSFLEAKAEVDERVIYVAVKVERSRDYSIGLKRNMCIHLASGAYVANFDDDDLYAPCYLTTMVEAMVEAGSDAITLGTWYIFDCKMGRFGRVIPRDHMNASNRRDMDGWTFGYGFSYVYTRDVALRIPYPDWKFDPTFASQEDWEFFTAVRLRNLRRQGLHCGCAFLPYMQACGTVVLEDTTGLCLHTLHSTSTSDCWAKIELPRDKAQELMIAALDAPFQRLLAKCPRRAGVSEFIPDSSKPPQRTVSFLDALAGRTVLMPGLARPPPLPRLTLRKR